jgi:murein DD-endopeptidase MepM/ murein hydrolase activator NlpD
MTAAQTQARRLLSDGSTPRISRGHRWTNFCLLLLIALSLAGSACAAPPRPASQQKPKGATHVVQKGQTLFRISQAYDVPVAVLVEANRLRPSAPLRVGQRLFIPGAAAAKTVEASRQLTTEERAALERSLREELTLPSPSIAPSPPRTMPPPPRPGVKTDAEFVWPIHGPINSPFGPRNGRLHAGIDIGSPNYQEVVAAADAEVIYANDTRGPLGKAVVLQHGRGMRTVYAHLSIIIARERDTVRQGQAIGGVGETGRATGPHLHFEVRRSGAPVNPEDYLPATIDELMRDLSTSK